MARPIPNTIDSENQGWDADIADNFAIIFDAPVPLVVASSMSVLNSTFPAAGYEKCLAIVNDGTAGWILALSDGSNWKKIGKQAANVVALTDNVAGTGGAALQAIVNPANTPASADALRDDIVANTLPPIRNDFTRLNDKVNEIVAALTAAGLMAP